MGSRKRRVGILVRDQECVCVWNRRAAQGTGPCGSIAAAFLGRDQRCIVDRARDSVASRYRGGTFLTSATGPVDVDKELASITTQLLDVASVRVDISSEPIGDTPEIEHARKLWLRHIEELDTNVVQPVMERITSLSEYRDRLRAVQIQTQTIRRIGKSAGIDERMDKLVAKSGRDVEGSSNIKSSTDEIHQAEVARSSALAEVRGDYLNALLP